MGTQIHIHIIFFAKLGDNWEKSKIWKHMKEFGPNIIAVTTINIFCLLTDYEHESQCVISHEPGFGAGG